MYRQSLTSLGCHPPATHRPEALLTWRPGAPPMPGHCELLPPPAPPPGTKEDPRPCWLTCLSAFPPCSLSPGTGPLPVLSSPRCLECGGRSAFVDRSNGGLLHHGGFSASQTLFTVGVLVRASQAGRERPLCCGEEADSPGWCERSGELSACLPQLSLCHRGSLATWYERVLGDGSQRSPGAAALEETLSRDGEPPARCWLCRSPAQWSIRGSFPPHLRAVREELRKFPTAGQASETRAHRAAGPGLPALPPDVRASLRAGSARPALLAAVTGGVNWDSQGTTTSKTYPQGPRPLTSKTQSRSSFCGGMDRRARKFMNWGRRRERSRYGCVRVLVLLVTLWQLGRAWPAAGPASPRRIGKASPSLNGAPLAASGPAAWGGGTAAPRPPCPVPGEASHPCSWPPAPPTQRASESIRSRCFAGTYYVHSSVWGDQMDETKWPGACSGGPFAGCLRRTWRGAECRGRHMGWGRQLGITCSAGINRVCPGR